VKNSEIASKLNEIADLLQQQQANPFRISAYRRAAAEVASLPQAITDIVQQKGFNGLLDIPAVGAGIARSIYEYVALGRMSRLESLKAGQDPVALFEEIPGIGPKLAHQILETLHIHSLEALELAAHNGRLASVPGFTRKKVLMVQAWLSQVLGRRRIPSHLPMKEPPIELLLAVDRRYRARVSAGDLPQIAPKRFNPQGKVWLPIMHSSKEGWHFTAMFSNTALAHQLQRSRDWVIIYFYDKDHHEGQHTIVTETRGVLLGQRVVRGRESECVDYYLHKSA